VGQALSLEVVALMVLFIGRNGTRLTAQSIWQRLVHNPQLTLLAIASYIPSVSLDSPKLLFSRGLRDE
jgi:hypothetical protein